MSNPGKAIPNKPERKQVLETVATFRDEFKVKERILVASSFVIIGIAEFISSTLLLVDSNRYFLGGIYLSGLSVVFGCCGFLLEQDTYWMSLISIVLICAIIASVLQGIDFGTLNQLQACAVYDPSHSSTSCSSTASYYDCSGDENYYAQAKTCAVSYHGGSDSNACNCFTKSSDCISFPGINTCDSLLTEIPQTLLASLLFSIFLATISLVSLWYRATYISPVVDPEKILKQLTRSQSKEDPRHHQLKDHQLELSSEEDSYSQPDLELGKAFGEKPEVHKALREAPERVTTMDESIDTHEPRNLSIELHSVNTPPAAPTLESPSDRTVNEFSKIKAKPSAKEMTEDRLEDVIDPEDRAEENNGI